MNNDNKPQSIEFIPIDKIVILNPRDRNKDAFQEIVKSIELVGLKKPISVTPRRSEADGVFYRLICGQGRLEAFKQLNQTNIPAIIRHNTDEECYLMSLVENLARRQHAPLDMLKEIENLSTNGYSKKQIAEKTGLSPAYTRDILILLDKGEERLISAVESKKIPMYIALKIVNSEDKEIQDALIDAFEINLISGKDLNFVRDFIVKRKMYGKQLHPSGKHTKSFEGKDLAKVYEDECARLEYQIQKADLTEFRLKFVESTLKSMLQDDNFINLMRAEKFDTLPKYIFE
jgi:ParB family chromosome partitioning protein